MQASQRTVASGPTLVRLLARLADADVSESRQSLSDRLSQWLGWTDAIALSTALSGNPPAAGSGGRALGSAEEKLCVRVRASLAKAIAGDRAPAAARRDGTAQTAAPEAAADFAEFRQRYLSLQQAMETDIGNLRGRLRAMLAGRSPEMARLAAVDAVMERALLARERGLLGAVPGLLGVRFERLREAEARRLADAEASDDAPAVAPGAWLDGFRHDMERVLLAELEVRFQPVEGLLAALRSS